MSYTGKYYCQVIGCDFTVDVVGNQVQYNGGIPTVVQGNVSAARNTLLSHSTTVHDSDISHIGNDQWTKDPNPPEVEAVL